MTVFGGVAAETREWECSCKALWRFAVTAPRHDLLSHSLGVELSSLNGLLCIHHLFLGSVLELSTYNLLLVFNAYIPFLSTEYPPTPGYLTCTQLMDNFCTPSVKAERRLRPEWESRLLEYPLLQTGSQVVSAE